MIGLGSFQHRLADPANDVFPIGVAFDASEAPVAPGQPFSGVSSPTGDASLAARPERVAFSGRESAAILLCLILCAWCIAGGFALRGWVDAPLSCPWSAR